MWDDGVWWGRCVWWGIGSSILSCVYCSWEEFAQVAAAETPGTIDGNEIGLEFFFEMFHGGMRGFARDFRESVVRH